VAAICRGMPALRDLDLSRMPLRLPPSPAPLPPALAQLEKIVLNRCPGGITWPYVLTLAPAVPHLKELVLGANGIASLASPSTSSAAVPLAALFPRLEILSLERNALDKWEDILPLGTLPALRSLNLNENRLETLFLPSGGAAAGGGGGDDTATAPAAPPPFFPLLESLLLGGNRLSSWASINVLQALPSLRETRVTGNPVRTRGPCPPSILCCRHLLFSTLPSSFNITD
jgi:Leucine-rich repeat (LRR) protein